MRREKRETHEWPRACRSLFLLAQDVSLCPGLVHGNYYHTWELFSSVLVDSQANFGKWSRKCELPTHTGHKTVFGHHCSLSFVFVNTKPMWWKQNRTYMEEQTDAQRKTGTRGGRPEVIKKLNIFMNLCQNEKTQRWVE